MTHIEFMYEGADWEQRKHWGNRVIERDWPSVPRVGEGVFLNVDGEEDFQGDVLAVLWDDKGTAQVRVR